MLDLPAGRELDVLIAGFMGDRRIMRGKWRGYWDCGKGMHYSDEDHGPLHYSTDIAAAWRVVEYLSALSITVEITALVSRANRSVRHIVYTYNNETCMPRDETIQSSAPHAICVVALKALTNQRREVTDIMDSVRC